MYQPRSNPYGNVFTINTNYIDSIANKVYQEQKLREQQKLQQDKALDDEFAKNVAGVKSADIPEITKAYSDFKKAHVNLQKKGDKATPQDQMDVMIKKADVFKAIAGSKEDKEYLLNRAKEGKNNKRYNPNYQIKISEKLNTPTSKRQRDLDDDDLLNKYAMPDINKEILAATKRDDGTDFELLVGVDEKDPLKDKYEEYKRINPPNIFYNKLFTGLGTRADNESFTRFVLDNTTDEEKQKLRTAYELKIADPNFKKLYGETQPFPASAANTELGQAVALKTMEAIVNLPIEKIKDKSVLNADRSMTAKNKFAKEQQARGFAQQKLMEGIRQANRKELFGMQQAAIQAGEDTYDLWVDRYIGKLKDDAKESGNTRQYKFSNGETLNGYTIQTDPVLDKALGFDDKNKGVLMVTDKGEFVPIFYQTNNNYEPIMKNGSYLVDATKTKKLNLDAIKLALGGRAGVKQLNKEMTKPSINTKTPKIKVTAQKGELDDL